MPRRYVRRTAVKRRTTGVRRKLVGRKRVARGRGESSKTKQMVTGHGPTLLERIAGGVGSVASVAKAVMPIATMINTEEKYHDLTGTLTAYQPGTNDTLTYLTANINQGTGDMDRIGNSILLRSINLRLAIGFPASNSVIGIHCRLLLIVWKADQSVDGITAAKLFETPSNLYSPVNKDRSDSFVILKDKFFSLNSNVLPAAGTLASDLRSWKIFKRCQWHVRWNGATGSSGLTQNHICMILRSSATGATNALGVTYYCRALYTDN